MPPNRSKFHILKQELPESPENQDLEAVYCQLLPINARFWRSLIYTQYSNLRNSLSEDFENRGEFLNLFWKNRPSFLTAFALKSLVKQRKSRCKTGLLSPSFEIALSFLSHFEPEIAPSFLNSKFLKFEYWVYSPHCRPPRLTSWQ